MHSAREYLLELCIERAMNQGYRDRDSFEKGSMTIVDVSKEDALICASKTFNPYDARTRAGKAWVRGFLMRPEQWQSMAEDTRFYIDGSTFRLFGSDGKWRVGIWTDLLRRDSKMVSLSPTGVTSKNV